MNLLVISTWCPCPPTNGAKLRAYHLLKGLAEYHRIHLLTFAETGEETAACRLAEFCDTVDVVPGNPAKAPQRLGLTGLTGDTPRAYVQGYSLEMQRLVDQAVKRSKVAVAMELPASLYIRGLTVPTLLEEVEVTAITQKADRASRLRRARHWLTVRKLTGFIRRLAAEVSQLTVVSELERQAVVRMGCSPKRVAIVPNGADPADLRRPPSLATPMTAIYPGALTYSANFDAVQWFLAEVWPMVLEKCPAARFVVTGSTQGVDLASLPPRQGVEFVGFVDDVKRVIEGSAACVVPLRVGGGTRLKVLEAMALGTPVISTSKGVEGLDVTADSDVLIGDSAPVFADQVLRLFGDDRLAGRLRAAGRALVERQYTWPRMAALLNHRIQQIAS